MVSNLEEITSWLNSPVSDAPNIITAEVTYRPRLRGFWSNGKGLIGSADLRRVFKDSPVVIEYINKCWILKNRCLKVANLEQIEHWMVRRTGQVPVIELRDEGLKLDAFYQDGWYVHDLTMDYTQQTDVAKLRARLMAFPEVLSFISLFA